MPSQEYWTERAEESAKKYYKQGDKSLARLERMFKVASDTMRNEIILFYGKYGIDKKSPIFGTLTDGAEVMTGSSVKRVVPSHEAYKYARIDSLQKQLNVILIELSREQNKYMLTELKQLAQGAYYNTWFDTFQGYGVGWQFNLLDPKVVKELATHPVHGQNFSTRVWNNRKLLSNQVNQELRSGITQGISTKEMSKRLSSKMESGYSVAERLMRTEITNTYNQATLQGYKDSGIVKQYEYLATLDNRTSEICQDLDGQVFDVDDAVTGLNYPPMHVRCRSTTVAKFDDEISTRRARDEKGNTYTVPSNVTYKEWAKKYL